MGQVAALSPHYRTHAHVVTMTTGACVPCDCYVCALEIPRTGARERRRHWVIHWVERTLEELESQLNAVGSASVVSVWRALHGGPRLNRVVRGVFRSLDHHGLIRCAHRGRSGACYLWVAAEERRPDPVAQ